MRREGTDHHAPYVVLRHCLRTGRTQTAQPGPQYSDTGKRRRGLVATIWPPGTRTGKEEEEKEE